MAKNRTNCQRFIVINVNTVTDYSVVTTQSEVSKITQNYASLGWAPATPEAQSVIGMAQRTLCDRDTMTGMYNDIFKGGGILYPGRVSGQGNRHFFGFEKEGNTFFSF